MYPNAEDELDAKLTETLANLIHEYVKLENEL